MQHLRRGDVEKARGFFFEALRLDPDCEYARFGLIESIKSKNIFYRYLFRLIVWITELPTGVAIGLLIASVFVRRTGKLNS